jgi:hypothetical protein
MNYQLITCKVLKIKKRGVGVLFRFGPARVFSIRRPTSLFRPWFFVCHSATSDQFHCAPPKGIPMQKLIGSANLTSCAGIPSKAIS